MWQGLCDKGHRPPNFAAKDFDITLPGKDDQKARIKDLKDSFKKDFYIDGLD